MKQLAIFDLDGVLVDSNVGITHCISQTLRAHPGSFDESPINQMIGLPLEDIFVACSVPRLELDEFIDDYRQRYIAEGIARARVFDGVQDLLSTLRARRLQLAIATSKLESIAVTMLEHHQLIDFFGEQNVIGHIDGVRINKTQLIDEALKRTTVAAREAVMIGDRAADMVGARANGVDAVGASWGYGLPGELEDAGADVIVNSPAELMDNRLLSRVFRFAL